MDKVGLNKLVKPEGVIMDSENSLIVSPQGHEQTVELSHMSSGEDSTLMSVKI